MPQASNRVKGANMQAKKCDRCEKLYEVYHKKSKSQIFNGVALVNVNNVVPILETAIDLCPRCMTEFMIWLYAEKNKKEE